MSTLVGGTEGPWHINAHVYHGEDFYEPLKIIDVNGDPFDLTSVTLQWIARPSLSHLTRFVLLTSVAEAGIIKEDAVDGLAAIFYSKANVEANLQINLGGSHWGQFFRMTFTDPDLGSVTRHLWVGSLFVHPAEDAATP